MAKHGILYETDPQIKNTQIRSVISTVNVDAGTPIVLGTKNAKQTHCFNGEVYSTGKQTVHIAYCPSVMYEVGEDGEIRPSQIIDRRYHYNVKGFAYDAFKPVNGIMFGITMANIEGNTAPTVGQFLEPTDGKQTYTVKASQTSDTPSFEVIGNDKAKFPTGDFTEDEETIYIVKTVYNN